MVEERTITDTAEWLSWRKADVTASEVAALPLIARSLRPEQRYPYKTPLKLFVEKSDPSLDFSLADTPELARGRILEPAFPGAVAREREHWHLEKAKVYLRDGTLRLGGTPDFWIVDPDHPGVLGVLEAKTASMQSWRTTWEEGETVPAWVTFQCLTNMMLANVPFGAVAVMVVDDRQHVQCAVHDVPRHPAAEKRIADAVLDFWRDVAEGREPEIDYVRDDALIRQLVPHETPGCTLDLTGNNELPELLAHRKLLLANIKRDQLVCDTIESQLRHLLGAAERASGLPGWSITYKTQHRKEYTVAATDFRVLRITDKRPKAEPLPEEDMSP